MTAAILASAVDARTVVINANGYTLDASGRLQKFTTLVIGDDGRVEDVRDAGDEYPAGDVVDAEGATLLPGLIDAHGHIMGLGAQLRTLDLAETTSLDEALEAIAAYAKANPDLPWIVGRGWNQVSWGMADFPTAGDLDQAVAGRPVILARVDGHAAWLNSAALRAARIDALSADPAGGRIERGSDGEPTGILVDTAMSLVDDVVPPPSPEERAARLDAALQAMAAAGLTAAADMGTSPEDWELYEMFARTGALTARIAAYARPYESFLTIAQTEPPGWQYQDRLAFAGLKIVADGALGSRGAAMLAPYSDAPEETGLAIVEGAQLRNQMIGAAQRGYQVAAHAIGDAANRDVLNAFADIGEYVPGGRHRVEHAQIVAPEDLARFGELGLIASVQPTHATSDKAMAEDRVGAERMAGAYAWRTLANNGARLALGSDFPVEPVKPLYGLHAAITREDRQGEPKGGWYPDEALSPVEALAGFTRGAAYAMNLEGRAGQLTPGMWADFILLGDDPLAGDPEYIWKIEVLETWFAGKRIYAAQ